MEGSARLNWSSHWLLPLLAVLVPLVCLPQLGDRFDLPKLFLLKGTLAVALLTVAAGAPLDRGMLRVPAAFAVLVFLSVNLLATVGSVEPRTSVFGNYEVGQGLLTLAVYIAYFFLAVSWIRTELALARLAAGFTLAAAISSVYAIAQHIGFDPLQWLPDEGRRAIGTFGHPNNLAEFLVMTMPMTVWLAWRGHGLRRDLPIWSLVTQMLALALTQARAAWAVLLLQMLIGGLLIICLRRGVSQHLARLLAIGPQIAVLAIFVALLAVPSSADSVDSLVQEKFQRGEPLASRQYLWQSTLAMVADRPLLGWGPDTFELVYPAYRAVALDEQEAEVQQADGAHNVLLTAAVNAGLPSAAVFLLVHVAIVLVLLHGASEVTSDAYKPPRAAALALLLAWNSYFVLFIFGQLRVTTDWFAWLIAGATLGLFASWPSSLSRMTGVVRLAPIILATGVIVEAGSALAADAAYARGMAAHKQGTFSDAVVWLDRAVSIRPFEPTYQQAFGVSLVFLGKEKNDEALLRAAVDRLSESSKLSGHREPYVLIEQAGAILEWEMARGRPTDAPLDLAQQGIALDPLNPLLYAAAADLAIRLNRPELARIYMETARRHSRSPDAFRRVGEVALQLGDPLLARNAFREATRRQWRRPYQAELYRAWGNAALAAGLPGEAALAFGEAVVRQPDDILTRLQRAEALATSGQHAAALQEAQQALDRAPDDPRAAVLIERLRRP